ncbi:hypothetical protein [Dokdonella sp.]|uniref:hypothetical protein n=1 Tax=Dokdonella sp. TaxID=2291710 RepID=UPI0025BD0FDD|nr:hypothetical protein [Dokdonella sp.]MBX3692286.1 hypothetical protein [Dokdonella sp.]
MRTSIHGLLLALGLAMNPAHAGELTDLWVDPVGGVRATLVQHGDRLALDLHQQVAIAFTPDFHAPALGLVGLDASGLPVFAGTLDDGVTVASVEPRGIDRIVVEIDAVPLPRRFELVRPLTPPLDLGGSWLGGYRHPGAACPQFSGPSRERAGVWTVYYFDEKQQDRVTMRFASAGQICHFNGRQQGIGVLTRVSGRFACNGAVEGSFETNDLVHTGNVFGGEMAVSIPACGLRRLSFGGIRRGP